MPNRIVNAGALILLLSGSALAQTGQPDPAELAKQNRAASARFQAGVDKAAALLEKDPRLGKLTPSSARVTSNSWPATCCSRCCTK
jgi:hypothetical protein